MKRSKASSSASSAAMSNSGFGNTGGFIGFSAFAETQSNSIDSFCIDSFYNGTNGQLQACFKNFRKKDLGTRIKAVTELMEIIESESFPKDEIRKALPHFYYHYERMSQKETDTRIRVLINTLLKTFFVNVRKIALRSCFLIIPELVCSNLSDATSAEVRQAAREALQVVNEDNLISRCYEDIKNLCISRIFEQNHTEEPWLRHRAIDVIPHCTDILSNEKSRELFEAISNSNKSWKTMLENIEPRVRISGFRLATFVTRQGFVEESFLTQEFLGTLCKRLDIEREAGVVNALFETFLRLLEKFHQKVFFLMKDYRKSFFPALWRCFAQGLHGAGPSVYPMLLPLLSLIPEIVWEDYGIAEFGSRWVHEMWRGLENPDALGPHGQPLLTKSTVECIAYVMKTKKSVPMPTLVALIRLYATEIQRFRIGGDLMPALRMAISQMDGIQDEETSDSLVTHLLDAYKENSRASEHIAELARSGTTSIFEKISKRLILWHLDHNEAFLSPVALYLLVKSVHVSFIVQIAPGIFELLCLKNIISDNADAMATFLHLLRHVENAQELWDLFEKQHANSKSRETLSKALCKLGTVDRISCMVRYAIAPPLNAALVSCMIRYGWLNESERTALLEVCTVDLKKIVYSSYYGDEPSDSAATEDAIAILSALDNFDAFHVPAHQWIWYAIATSLVHDHDGEVAYELEQERQTLLFETLSVLFRESTIPWDHSLCGSWARTAMAYHLSDQVTLLQENCVDENQKKRLLEICVNMSEQTTEGTLLDFDEPSSLLCLLLEASSGIQDDWRNAILIPFVLGDEVRAYRIVEYSLRNANSPKSASLLLEHMQHAGPLVCDDLIEGVVWPFFCDCVDDFDMMALILKYVRADFIRLGLLDQLIQHDTASILDMVQDSKLNENAKVTKWKAWARATTDTQTIAEETVDRVEEEDAVDSSPPPTQFSVGEAIIYTKTFPHEEGSVIQVHNDDAQAAYYTIRIHDQREIQTIAEHLRAKYVVPTTLQELNQMLAAARRAGDHKESIRLMQLQPSLLPKPVDTEQARKQALERARKRHEDALSYMNSSTNLFRQTNKSRVQVGEFGEGASYVSEKDMKLRSIKCLNHIAAVGLSTNKMEDGLLDGLVRVVMVLPYFLSPQDIASELRVGPSEMMLSFIKACVRLFSTLYHANQVIDVPEQVDQFVHRCVLACLGNRGLVNDSCKVIQYFDKGDTILERVHEILVGLLVDKSVCLSEEAIDLLHGVPERFLLKTEKSQEDSLLTLIMEETTRSDKLSSVFRFALHDDALLRVWFSKVDMLLKHCENTSIEFPSCSWRMVLYLVHRMRRVEPDNATLIQNRFKEQLLINRALRWCFLDHPDARSSSMSSWKLKTAVDTLRIVPALSRQWFADPSLVNKSDYVTVQKLIRLWVTPQIVDLEIRDIETARSFDPPMGAGCTPDDIGIMKVTCSKASRTIVAHYEKECTVEFEIVIPQTFPLDNVEIRCTKQLGIRQERWRRWMLQMTTLLSAKDGSLLDAIRIFKGNLDNEFRGVDPCPICYTVLHVQDQSLPKMKCSTCKNGFHSKCLVQWFSTSHKNECPMCKQNF